MSQYLMFLLLGLGSGAVYAALGTSLTVSYRASGILNFAVGATAMYATYVYVGLRNEGAYLNPVIGLAPSIDLGGPWGFWPALALALVTAALLGWLLHLVVFSHLENALPITRVVASVGVMLVLQNLIGLRAGTALLTSPPIFPSGSVDISTGQVPQDRFYLALSVVAMGVVLWALSRFTAFGLRARAVADSPEGAAICGVAPGRVAALSSVLSAVIAGLSGILISPLIPLSPAGYTLFVVPALAAALMGRLTRIGPTIAAGLALGMVQSLLGLLQTKSWYPSFLQAGVAEALPLVLIVTALVIGGRSLPQRGTLAPPSMPAAYPPRHLGRMLVVVGVCGAVGLVALSGSYRAGLITSMTLAVLCLSVVAITGLAGQISLAQLSLAGVAAFVVARFGDGVGLPFPLPFLLAVLVATGVGVVVGLPALRVRGVQLAVITLAAAVAIDAVYFRNPVLNGGLTGSTATGPEILGIDLSIHGPDYPRAQFGFFVLVVLLGTIFLLGNVRRGILGSRFLAVRANERAAAAAGIDVSRTKLLALALGSFLAGISGVLIAYQRTQVSSESFLVFVGISLFALVYIAGVTTIPGALVAGLIAPLGLIFTVIDRLIHMGEWFQLISGVLLVFTAIVHPNGLVGDLYHLAERRRTARALAHREASEPGDGAHALAVAEGRP